MRPGRCYRGPMRGRGRRRFLVVVLVAAMTIAASSAVSISAPLPVRDLPTNPTWRAGVPNASTPWGPEFAHGDVYVPTSLGVIAYPRRCADACEPLWRSNLREDRMGYEVTARAGYVTAAGERRLHVFDAGCANDGGICTPLWSVAGGAMSAHITGTSVVATFSEDAGIRVAVFPLSCTDGCAPIWSRLVKGRYPSYGPPVLADGTLYLRRGSVLYGVSLGCARGVGDCGVVFRVGHVPDATFPAVTSDRVIFGTGRDEATELAAYPTDCGRGCSPVWVADAGGYVESPPEVAGDLVVTWSKGRVVAFPVACTDPCTPAWTARARPYAVVHHADDERVIAVSHFRNPAVYAFPTVCPATCEPTWVRRFADDVEPFGTDIDEHHLFVAFPGRVIAYDLATGVRSWRGALDDGSGWWLDADQRSLLVALRAEGFAGGTALNGFVATP